MTKPIISALRTCILAVTLASPLCAEECGEYGTQVEFADSVSDAAKEALATEKLVFVLHVSGNFETSEYT